MDGTVQKYFKAMQRGADGEDDLVGLFAGDAVCQEPFGGRPPDQGRADRFTIRDGKIMRLESEVLEPRFW
jgi:hypothetical protein